MGDVSARARQLPVSVAPFVGVELVAWAVTAAASPIDWLQYGISVALLLVAVALSTAAIARPVPRAAVPGALVYLAAAGLLRNATGDILFLSDDDDLWAPDKVARFMAAFAQGEQVQVVMSAVALIDPAGKPFRDPRWDRNGRFTRGFWRNVLKNQYQGSAMAFRATLLGSVLPFKRQRTYLHDVWIGTVNDRERGGLVYLPEPLLLYRRHPGNFSRKLSRWAQVRLRLQLLGDHLRGALEGSRAARPRV